MSQHSGTGSPEGGWGKKCLFGLVLIPVVFIAYWRALHGAFIWDDQSWTSDILPLFRNFSGLRSIWTDPTALQQYYPLSGTTFWLDYQFWKFWTFPYHVENVLLHLAAAFLFWRLLCQLKVPGAALAAGIFALHPIMAESVAWITERKNVLSICFFLGALIAYGNFNSCWQASQPPPRRRWLWYGFALFLFIAALLAKTSTFSLPAVVLLVAWWKNGRISWRKDVLPTLPFFAIAIFGSALTASLEKSHVGAQGWEWDLSFPQRCLIAGRTFWFYLSKLFWPHNLCFIYPRWKPDAAVWWQWLFPIMTIGVLIGLWASRKRIGRGPATAAFFFVGTLFPVLGFMNAYGARYSFVWDHWVYLSSLGIITFGAALIAHLAVRLKASRLVPATIIILLPVLALLTWKQTAMYTDIETLWQTTITKNPTAFLAYNNLGYILMEKNQLPDAIAYFNKSLEINPRFSEPHNNLGDALVRLGKVDEGITHFQKAADLDPGSPASFYNLGNAWLETGHPDKAVEQFKNALQVFPDFAKAQNNLGCALLRLGRTNEAFGWFQKAITNEVDLADAHNNLASIYWVRGQTVAATEQFRETFQLQPDFPGVFDNLTRLLLAQGKTDEAIKCYELFLRQNETPALHNDLANLLVRQKRYDEAVSEYESALKLKPDNGEFQFNLGVTFLLMNRLADAEKALLRAIELMPDSAPAHYRLGLVCQLQKQFAQAIAEYQKALDLSPDYLSVRNNLAWVLATCPDASVRNGTRAVDLALGLEHSTTPVSPQFLDTVAAAYAEAGQFPEAITTIKQAIDLATSQGDAALVKALHSRADLYDRHTAYHELP